MHTSGHVGLSFAVAAPIAVSLEAVGFESAIVPATVVLVSLSTLPDVDEYLPGTTHRGGTHSLVFAVGIGVLIAGLGWLAGHAVIGGDRAALATLGFALGALAVLVHVLADLLTPMGVYPLWPFSRERRTLDVVSSADRRANLAVLAVGVVLWCGALVLTWFV